MSQFVAKVYEITAKIPRGRVATYGQIAAMAGSPLASRAVGEAMRKVPEYVDIPCHRVVNSTGNLAPGYAFGGQERQREILKSEGVTFREDGRIDMKKSLWRID